MSLQLNDRVKETSSSTGTDPIVLSGPTVGYQSIASSISPGNTFPYVVELTGGAEWEIGVGEYVSGNNSIIRTQILGSSNSGNIVNFSAGAKNVFITVPSAYAALTARGLSQFSTTTSAELASIISDETGSGQLVFSNNAILVAPDIGTANGTSLTLSGDLNVTGNVYLSGNVTTLSSNNLSINDPLIYLAQDNPANLQDIGLVGQFTNAYYEHTGFVRDASDGVWKLFSNVVSEPTTTIDFVTAVYDTLQIGSLITSNAIFSVANGSAPFTVESTTLVSNLNVDLLDGQYGAYYTGLTGVAFDQANSAYTQANTGVEIGQGVFAQANSAYTQANTGVTIGQGAFAQANSAYTQANTGITIGQAAFSQANSGFDQANSAYTQANTAVAIGQAAFAQANSGFSQANTGVTTGQAAFAQANAAYNTANTKFSANGGTISGSVTITTDLSVTGNVYLSGNVTTLSSNNLSINDPLIYLGQDNPANLQDMGFIGHFTGPTYQHTGFARDASDGVWKLFSNVVSEPTTTVDFSTAVYDTLQVGSLITSNATFSIATGTSPFTVTSNTVVVNLNADLLDGQDATYYTGLTGVAFDQANSAYSQANTGILVGQGAFVQANTGVAIGQAAFAQANVGVTVGQGAFAQANTAYGQANTGISVGLGAFSQANTAYGQANTGILVGQGAFDQANTGISVGLGAFAQANIAYGQANTGVAIGQGAFDQANTGISVGLGAFAKANTGVTIGQNAFGQANAAYSQANTGISVGEEAYNQANVAYNQANTALTTGQNAFDQANSAYTQANTGTALANSAYNQANTGVTIGQGAFVQANTALTTGQNAFSQANSAYTQANTGVTIGQGAFAQANSAYTQANTGVAIGQAAFAQANTGVTIGQGAFAQANSAYTQANTGVAIGQAAFAQANTGVAIGQGAFAQANSAYTQANTGVAIGQGAFAQANSGFSQANTGITIGQAAFAQANAAYNTANTKFSANGGTISGSVTITTDLNVTGNVYLGGNVTTLSSNNLSVSDPLIYLAMDNPANLQDIGFIGHFTGPTYQHTGFARDASDGVWKLFSNVASEPTTTVDFSTAVYDTLQVGSIKTSNAIFSVATGTSPFTVTSNTVVVNLNADLLDGQDATYYTNLSSSAYTQANTGVAIGQAAFAVANTETIGKAAFGQANTGVAIGQAAFAVANTGVTISQAAFGQANSAYTQANTGVTISQAAFGQANSAFAAANTETIGKAAFGQANSAYTQANSAYDRANTGITLTQVVFGQANAAYNQANTANTGLSTKAILKGTATEYGGAKFSLTGTTLTITTT